MRTEFYNGARLYGERGADAQEGGLAVINMAAVPGGVGVYAGAYYYYFFGAGTGVVIIGFVACAIKKEECAKQGDGEDVFHGVIFCSKNKVGLLIGTVVLFSAVVVFGADDGAFASAVTVFGSDDIDFGSDCGVFASAFGVFGSDYGGFASAVGVFTSDCGVFGSAVVIFGSAVVDFGSDCGVFGSDAGVFGSDAGVFGSDVFLFLVGNQVVLLVVGLFCSYCSFGLNQKNQKFKAV